jgi:glycerophosphoryl diester phosphodiesterase
VFLVNFEYFIGKKPLIIPHRGGANIVPENTRHGLEFITEEGFRHFETDLRMSKDGEIFLHHDDSFDRTADVVGKVKDFNWIDISKINAGYKFYKKKGIPDAKTNFIRLADALEFNRNLNFNLDLKQSGMAKKVAEIIYSLKAEKRVLVSSFSPKRLDEFLEATKGDILSSGTFRENLIAKFLPIKKRKLKIQALQAPYNLRGFQIHSKKLFEFCKINDLQLHIWTVNTVERFQDCIDIGCDGVITDEPILLRDYLAST